MKKRGIIHLGIIERELLPYGQARPQEATQPAPIKPSQTKSFALNNMGVEEDIDYHKLTYENRSINLDTIIAPAGHVVTGVRFCASRGHISLEIRATEFDYRNGTLKNHGESKWVSNSNVAQLTISLERSADPLKCTHTPLVNETLNTFVEFGPTDYWTDVGQLTIPYFDTKVVESYTPVALSGVGLVFKGRPGFGGFIAPKLMISPFKVGD